MRKFFSRIQWKLTLSYALVTAGTVVVLSFLFIGVAIFFQLQSSRAYDSFYWSKTAFQDNIPFLLDDSAVLQAWVERVQKSGFEWKDLTQTKLVRYTLDYANTLVKGSPIYVLDPKLNLIAATPLEDPSLLGKPLRLFKYDGYVVKSILTAALTGDKNYYAQSMLQPDGSYISAFPLRKSDNEPVGAIVIYHVKPRALITPAYMEFYQTFFIMTAALMLVVSVPVGAIFGWLASRGLRRRLNRLAVAAQSWSSGEFTPVPSDQSGDEIGELTHALNRMAEQLQNHIHTRDELARVEERNRLARDLHDTVKQQTYAARMQLSAAKNLLASDPQAASEHLETALQLNRETQQELKLIIDELRPAALQGRGLAQALAETAARWQEHTGIKVETSIRGDRSLPLDVEQALYRVLQESLSNIARHAEADLVQIILLMTPERVTLSIADNGRGFEPAAVQPNSLGLRGMKDRIGEVGGALAVESKLSVGTQIHAEVKLSE
jgi:two-component system, NarL family, sensor histidine kinase LiaS